MITQNRLKQLAHYDPDTGILTWKVKKARAEAGDVLGSITKSGYMETSIDGLRYYVHRLVWLYVYGEFPVNNIDHINRDRSDNRISNLRDVPQRLNNRNQSINTKNKSGVKGVRWDKSRNKRHCYINVNNKQKFIGYFDCKLAATILRHYAERCYGFL
jgi:hypothetical protein